jgi:hypothetical protein
MWKDGDSLLANAEMYRNTGDECHQLLVGRDANTNMPFPLPPWGHQSPIGFEKKKSITRRRTQNTFSVPLQELGCVAESERSLFVLDVVSRQKLIHLLELKQE